METLSCHSNESTWAMTIKNIIYVEANVMNMYAKFQSCGFGMKIFEYKIHMNPRGLLKKHFCKKKNLTIYSETAKIANFHFSHCKSMATKLP